MKSHYTLALCLTLAMTMPAGAQDDTFNIEELTCFEVVSLPEEDALFVTAMLIGFANGKTGTSLTSATAIREAVEAFDAQCGEEPNLLAVEAIS